MIGYSIPSRVNSSSRAISILLSLPLAGVPDSLQFDDAATFAVPPARFYHAYRMTTSSGPLQNETPEGREFFPALARKSVGRDFLLLAEVSPAMIWMADLHGRCTYVNWAWLKFRGRTVEQELGKGYLSAIHPEDLKGCLSTASRAYPARKPFLVRYRALRADGQYCPVEDVARPWFDAD